MTQYTYYSNIIANIMLLQTSIFENSEKTTKMAYFKYNVNPSNRVGMEGVFLGLAGLLLRTSLRLRPWEIPWSGPACP